MKSGRWKRLSILILLVGLSGLLAACGSRRSAQNHDQLLGQCILTTAGNCDGADLSGAQISGSFGPVRSFSCVGCDFSHSLHMAMDWTNSDFRNTDWLAADLSGSNFNKVDLTGALNLTQEQLDQLESCWGAVLPEGLVCGK